jgi:signal transduction histidine kinase/ligand-binding sensor domain-containing protein
LLAESRDQFRPPHKGEATWNHAFVRRIVLCAVLALWPAFNPKSTSPLWGGRNAERLSRKAFRVGGLMPSHAPRPKLLAESRDQFRPPHKGEATWNHAFVRRIGCCLAVAGAMLWSTRALALDPALDISQYGHTAWKLRDGFTSSAISSLSQTADGYLWLGTGTGLVRFDGVRATPWQAPPGQTLPSGEVRALLGSRDGTLWVGTQAGLASWNGGMLRTYPQFSGNSIDSLLEDREGTVWVSGKDSMTGRLCAIRKTGTECVGDDGRFGANVRNVYEDRKGNLWLAAQNGLWRWKPGPPQLYIPPSPVSGSLQVLTETETGAILLITGAGLQQFAGGKFQPLPLPARSPILSLFRDSDGAIWAGTTDGGLFHLHNGRIDNFGTSDGLSGLGSTRIFQDREGNMWTASLGGLDRFRALPAATYAEGQGTDGIATSVLADREGGIWLATTAGLYRRDNGAFSVYRSKREASSPPRAQVQTNEIIVKDLPSGSLPPSLLEDSHGRLWFGSPSGFGYVQDGRFVSVGKLPSAYIDSIAEDRQGNIWLAHRTAGVLRVSADLKVEPVKWQSSGNREVWYRLAADPVDGGVWIGSLQGSLIHLVDGEERGSYSTADGLGQGLLSDVRVGADGTAWIATMGGLSRIRNGRVATLSTKNGLPCDAVTASIEDDEGATWLDTACGLARIARSNLGAWATAIDQGKPAPVIQVMVLANTDGVQSLSPPAGATSPHLTKARDGKLWLTTSAGVTAVDPRHLYVNTLPPPVHIEQVVADRKAYALSGPVDLPPLVRDLTIDYTGLSLVAPEKNQFRYRLEGRDRDWEDAGNRRQAFYTDLPPGNYRFRVIASNNSGVWNEQGAALAFSIAPAYWQTNWFLALCATAFVALLWGLYQLRMRQLARARAIERRHRDMQLLAENRQRELELELAHANRLATMGQLTASIAHEVNQPLTASILNAGSALRWLKTDPPDLGEIRQSLDRIVRDGNRAADVVARIRGMAKKAPAEREDLVVNTKITNVLAIANSEILKHGVVNRTELAPDLPLVKGDRVQIQQVLLNLILNAVEAMSTLPDGPRELVIRSERDESGNVLVSVRDTGPGLSPEAMDRIFQPFYTSKKEGLGLGLSICQSIIEAHGGRLWASANSPRGAVFQFTLPKRASP